MPQDKAKKRSSKGLSTGVRPARLYKTKARSRVTNGHQLLANVDGRTLWVRRCRDLIALHLSDLGGEGNTSAAERSIIRRAAVLQTELEQREAKFAAAGEATDQQIEVYQRVSNSLRRLLESVGLQRRAKPVPSLEEYLRMKEAAE